nr:MAG TPA: hypothetical protein [Caudoviricetes sp.]
MLTKAINIAVILQYGHGSPERRLRRRARLH